MQESISSGKPVTTTTSLRLRFDRFLLPASALRQSVCLRSDTATVEAFDQCAGAVFLEPAYDPVRREVTYRLRPGEPLAPDTEYKLTVFGAVDPRAVAGFRAFDGARLENTAYQFSFRTNAADPAGTADEVGPQGDTFCKNDPCVTACGADQDCAALCPVGAFIALRNGCGFKGCHKPGDDVGAAMGMDLSDPSGIALTAVGHNAHHSQQGERADDPDLAPVLGDARRFGRAMPLIAPGSPGNSYILYKIIAGFDRSVYAADERLPPVSPDEIARLRASVVGGMPMPPGSAIDAGEIASISAWIAQGAEVTSCP